MAALDRQFMLQDLLGASLRKRLQGRLDLLVGAATVLQDRDGALLWGNTLPEHGLSVALDLELEPVGFLVSSADRAERLKAAAEVLEAILQQRAQYLMAADLHVEAVQADYENLLAKNAELAASEARLRALSGKLEEQVREQVALIEARQRQLYETERLAAVGQLAAGVAHEINNPIGFVRSNLVSARRYVSALLALRDALGRETTPGLREVCERIDFDFMLDDFGALLDDSIQGADRIAGIVRDLKSFSNVDGAGQELFDLGEKLLAVCAMIESSLPAGVRLNCQVAAQLPWVNGHVGHLNQAFFNLIRNAVQAVSGRGGQVVVRVGAEQGTLQGAPQDVLRIDILDNGEGMAPEVLKRAFEPFFSTRGVGEGTGLGLSVARDVVRAHHGRISLESVPDKGSRVRVLLPAVAR